jgi:hypothetical protein
VEKEGDGVTDAVVVHPRSYGLWQTCKIPGIQELIFSMLIKVISADGLEACNYTANSQLFFDVSLVSKQFALLAKNCICSMVCRYIKNTSETEALCFKIDLGGLELANVNTKFAVPSLRHLSVSGRGISNGERNKKHLGTLHPNTVFSWNCTRLETLYIGSTISTPTCIQAMALQFPNLKHLNINIESRTHFIITNFTCLITMYLSIATDYQDDSKNAMRLHIVNLPSLQKVDFLSGAIRSLEVHAVPNLTTIANLNNEFGVKEVIFHDPVPYLQHIDLGLNRLLILDPFGHVCWKRVQTLSLQYEDDRMKTACLQLEAIRDLHIVQLVDTVEFQWQNLTTLSSLDWTWPRANFFTDISFLKETLTSLDLQWDGHEFTLDFRNLLAFSKISNLVLASDESATYVHFEALFRLPHLTSFHCMIDSLSDEDEELQLLAKWIDNRRIVLGMN